MAHTPSLEEPEWLSPHYNELPGAGPRSRSASRRAVMLRRVNTIHPPDYWCCCVTDASFRRRKRTRRCCIAPRSDRRSHHRRRCHRAGLRRGTAGGGARSEGGRVRNHRLRQLARQLRHDHAQPRHAAGRAGHHRPCAALDAEPRRAALHHTALRSGAVVVAAALRRALQSQRLVAGRRGQDGDPGSLAAGIAGLDQPTSAGLRVRCVRHGSCLPQREVAGWIRRGLARAGRIRHRLRAHRWCRLSTPGTGVA